MGACVSPARYHQGMSENNGSGSVELVGEVTVSPGYAAQTVNRGLASMLCGGVIMDVVTADQARLAEACGAVSVMALERVPADIRRDGGVARMSDLALIQEIMHAVTIPVMAKVRIGHFAEAELLEELGVDFIDESEVLTPADEQHHINKWDFRTPFVCGARDLGEALRRISEGASMIRTKGEAGTGNVVEAVRHMRAVNEGIAALGELTDAAIEQMAEEWRVPPELVAEVRDLRRLPVVNFAAGGIATPADAMLMRKLGAEGNFVGSGIFKSEDPESVAKSIVAATSFFDHPEMVVKSSMYLGQPMRGLEIDRLPEGELLATRGI